MITYAKVDGTDIVHFFLNDVFVFEMVTRNDETIMEVARALLAMKMFYELKAESER
jgi:hypothetical protein